MMSANKSIDGLSTKNQKKRSSNMPTIKKATRKSLSRNKKILVDDFSLEVTPELSTTVADLTSEIDSTSNTDVSDINPAPELDIDQDFILEQNQKISDQSPTDDSNQEHQTDATLDFLSPVQAFNFDEETGELQEDKKNHTKKADMKSKTSDTNIKVNSKKTKKKGKKRRVISIIVLLFVLIVGGFVTWTVFWGNDIIAKITGGQGNVLDLLTFVDETYEPLQTDKNGRTNILAFGTSGFDMSGEEYGGVHDGAALTDSIMVISLNQETGDIAMLSLPRDLKASPTCTATGKINEVYWCNNIDGNNEEAGARALMEEVGSILGIDFQYYAHLNWGSLVNIVDMLDGIKVTLDENIEDYYYTGSVYQAGVEYTLNGIQAVALSRARHGTNGGDFSRGASQQKILVGIKDKIFEKNLSITDLIGLASNLGDNLRTNFSVSNIKTLAHLTQQFDFESMRTVSLYPDYMVPGTINGISYVIPSAGAGNYRLIKTFVDEQFSNDPRDYEKPTILVLNATDTAGLASNEKTKLTDEGYTNITIDNAPEGTYPIGYTIYQNNSKPGTKNLLETLYNISIVEEVPDVIPKNYDFVIVINTPNDGENTN